MKNQIHQGKIDVQNPQTRCLLNLSRHINLTFNDSSLFFSRSASQSSETRKNMLMTPLLFYILLSFGNGTTVTGHSFLRSKLLQRRVQSNFVSTKSPSQKQNTSPSSIPSYHSDSVNVQASTQTPSAKMIHPSASPVTITPSVRSFSEKEEIQPTHSTSSPSILKEPTDDFTAETTPPPTKPSLQLSSKPSLHPSIVESFPPTTIASSKPSMKPSHVPSNSKSHNPSSLSMHPSNDLSDNPSIKPSLVPSQSPFQEPSLTPTSAPSVEMSLQPSLSPTMEPSNKKSNLPSQTSSNKPSQIPSPKPIFRTETPSMTTSAEPNFRTETPSINQSAKPSINPSTKPSLMSVSPTTFPSSKPNLSTISSKNPSIQRHYPTTAPESNQRPSIPSHQPSLATFAPSDNALSTAMPSGTTENVEFMPSTRPSLNESTDTNNSDSNVLIYGGISLGVGFLGMLSLILFLFRRTLQYEDTIVDTFATEESMESFPSPGENGIMNDIESDSSRNVMNSSNAPTEGSTQNMHNSNGQVGNTSKKIPNCEISYSEDSSDVFQGLGMSLPSCSSVDSLMVSSTDDISAYGKSNVGVLYPPKTLPIQQLRSNNDSASQRKIIEKQSPIAQYDSQSESSILETEVLQQTGNQKSVARLLSCFSSPALMQNVQHLPKRQNNRSAPVCNLDNGSDVISVVSSLSGKSSCSETTLVFHDGEPYEVLVPGSKALGLVVTSTRTGPQIVHVKNTSPLHQIVENGDFILSVDGIDCRHISAKTLSKWLHKTDSNVERTMILMGRKNSYHHFGQSMI